jgi:hypothetical protein
VPASPLDSTPVPISVELLPSARGRQAPVRLNPAPLITDRPNGKYVGDFEILFMQLGPKNQLLDVTQKNI